MTEQEWLQCDDSLAMLEFLLTQPGARRDSVSRELHRDDDESRSTVGCNITQRKLRLFGCACARRVKRFGSPNHLNAIRTSEQFADGLVDRVALEAAFEPVRALPEPIPCDADFALSVFGPTDMAWEARLVEAFSALGPDLNVLALATKTAEIITECEGAEQLARRGRKERSQQAHLLRDIFVNPSRPVQFDRSRLTSSTLSLAERIYDDGQFDELPQLANALKRDIGCTNEELLNHCIWPIRHVRGCWAVDLLLGKS